MRPVVYLLHGRDSSPESLKMQRLAAVAKASGWRAVIPDFSSTTDPDQRVSLFLEQVGKEDARRLFVGSSMGGYVALVASQAFRPDGLLLLAPALQLPGYRHPEPTAQAGEAVIVHGWNDEVIAPESVIRYAAARKTSLHLVDDDHRLHRSLPFIESIFRALLLRCAPISRKSRLIASL